MKAINRLIKRLIKCNCERQLPQGQAETETSLLIYNLKTKRIKEVTLNDLDWLDGQWAPTVPCLTLRTGGLIIGYRELNQRDHPVNSAVTAGYRLRFYDYIWHFTMRVMCGKRWNICVNKCLTGFEWESSNLNSSYSNKKIRTETTKNKKKQMLFKMALNPHQSSSWKNCNPEKSHPIHNLSQSTESKHKTSSAVSQFHVPTPSKPGQHTPASFISPLRS